MGVCSERVEIIPNVWCGANFVEADMIWYFVRALRYERAIFVAVTEVTFRGRRSILCTLDVWTRKVSWQAQGIVRLRVVVEVNVAVTLGLACGQALCAKLLGRAA